MIGSRGGREPNVFSQIQNVWLLFSMTLANASGCREQEDDITKNAYLITLNLNTRQGLKNLFRAKKRGHIAGIAFRKLEMSSSTELKVRIQLSLFTVSPSIPEEKVFFFFFSNLPEFTAAELLFAWLYCELQLHAVLILGEHLVWLTQVIPHGCLNI